MDRELYLWFIKSIELDDINLVEIAARRLGDAGLPVDHGVSYELESEDALLCQDELKVTVKVSVSAFKKADVNKSEREETSEEAAESRAEFFTLVFKLELVYAVPGFEEKVTEDKERGEIIQSFCRLNVPLNAWPYARELISSTTVRMGYPALVIGTYKVGV